MLRSKRATLNVTIDAMEAGVSQQKFNLRPNSALHLENEKEILETEPVIHQWPSDDSSLLNSNFGNVIGLPLRSEASSTKLLS